MFTHFYFFTFTIANEASCLQFQQMQMVFVNELLALLYEVH